MEFDEDKAEVLALAFANVSSSTNYSAELQRHKKDIEQNHAYQLADDAPVTEMTEHLNKEFAQPELNLAIQQLKKNSAEGMCVRCCSCQTRLLCLVTLCKFAS